MSDLVKLSKPQLDILHKFVGHWSERYQTTPEELAKTFFDPETGRTMDPQRLREIMDDQGDVLSNEDIRIFTEVVCEELKQAEENTATGSSTAAGVANTLTMFIPGNSRAFLPNTGAPWAQADTGTGVTFASGQSLTLAAYYSAGIGG